MPARLPVVGPCSKLPLMDSTLQTLQRFWIMTLMFSVSKHTLGSHLCTRTDGPVDALSQDELYSLDMGVLGSTDSSTIDWINVSNAPYPTPYSPIMALAQNHIHFLNVPGASAGSAYIFVIHCEHIHFKFFYVTSFCCYQFLTFSQSPSRMAPFPTVPARLRPSSKKHQYELSRLF